MVSKFFTEMESNYLKSQHLATIATVGQYEGNDPDNLMFTSRF